MRVIAGSARRLLLSTLPGEDTRPTTDRIKETLFNMLQPEVPGSRFLDLFGGSGGIAIEALSRGASSADKAELLATDASAALTRLAGTKCEPFDLVFLDPPYGAGLEERALQQLRNSGLIHDDTLLIVEAKIDADPSRFEALGYRIVKIKAYKTNQHIFLQRGNDET